MGALPVELRQSGKSGAAPWWRWSTGQPADGRTSAGTSCCIPGDPGHGTGRLLTALSSVKHNIAHQPHVLIWHGGLVLILFFMHNKQPNLQFCEHPRGFLQDCVHTVCHRHRVLPVVVGHAAVVLPNGHGETTQLLQLKASWETRQEVR